MKPPVWVLRETVLALHEQLLAEFGGSVGIRDEALLEFALARPEHLAPRRFRWVDDSCSPEGA